MLLCFHHEKCRVHLHKLMVTETCKIKHVIIFTPPRTRVGSKVYTTEVEYRTWKVKGGGHSDNSNYCCIMTSGGSSCVHVCRPLAEYGLL